MFSETSSYKTIGTTGAIYIPRDKESAPIRPGMDYFFVKINAAQAAFNGQIWDRIKNLVVATQVHINHPILGQEGIRAIQRTREVRRGKAERLGLQPNLISLVPAIMSDISISIEFILDKENSLRGLSGLINNDSFLAMVSLAPGYAMVAKTISGLAGKIIETFVPAEEREPILQFSGDFNLVGEDLKDGYYVFLGTRDDQNPLPDPLPKLQVGKSELLVDGKNITQLSYVVIDIHRVPTRTRALNDSAPWEAKLREAEDEAHRFIHDLLATDEERKSAWEKCRNLIKEAQTLIRSDINYQRTEAETIIKESFSQCNKDFNYQPDNHRIGSLVQASRGNWTPDIQAERLFMDIPVEENLDAILDLYSEQVKKSQDVLRDAGIVI